MPSIASMRAYRLARPFTLAALLLFVAGGLSGIAHEREATVHALTSESVARALDGADWAIAEARGTEGSAIPPLAADAPAADLARWLPAAADIGNSGTLEAFRERLGALGYDTDGHDPFVLWQDDMYRTLAAYDALTGDGTGDDPARLWEALNGLPAESEDPDVRAEIDRLRRRIDLATVPEEDRAAVRPHMDRIARLLSIAREWSE